MHTHEETYSGLAAGRSGMNRAEGRQGQEDMVDSTAKHLDRQAKRTTGASALHWATLLSIGASITLFLAGRRELAIFIGLWPPTIQALKANAERSQESRPSQEF